MLQLNADDVYLDIGCATGWAVRYAATIILDDSRCYGIDISEKMIAIARNNNSERAFTFKIADSAQIPFPDNYFTKLTCMNSFHHYYDPIQALDEMKRIIRPGGTICLLDPTRDGWFMRYVDAKTKREEKEHVCFYATDEYRDMFEKSRLKYIGSKRIIGPIKVHIARKA